MKSKIIFAIIGVLSITNLVAQCSLVLASDSLEACVGDTIFLSVSGANSYQWSHDATLSCDTCASPYIILTDTSQYVVVQGSSQATQMATNGNFSSGNTGFLSNYTYNATSIWNESTYAVGPNPNAVHPNFGTWGDHTTGTGNYMLVNGATGTNKILWRQTKTFPPGAQVTMRWWALSFVSPAGQLQLKLSGTNIGGAASTPTSTGVWQQTSRTFTAPASGTATLNLITLAGPGSGNDFGIDDISFTYTCEAYDTVWISSKSDAQILLDSMSIFGCDSVCFELENELDTNGLLNYQWVLSDGTVDSSSIFSHCLSDSGTYNGYLLTTSSEGCTDSVALPIIRVGHTRQLDSLVIVNDGSVFSGAFQVLNPEETIGLLAHYETLNSNGLDSIFISAGSQSWNDGNITGSQLASGWGPVVLDPEPQTVCAFLYTSQGCVDSICRQIAFFPTVEVPNVFTPNSDGVNDELVLQTTSTDRIKTTIYSRWGTKVFESSVLGEYWDGRFEGRPLASGVYFLTVEVANPYAPSPITTTATVHLLR